MDTQLSPIDLAFAAIQAFNAATLGEPLPERPTSTTECSPVERGVIEALWFLAKEVPTLPEDHVEIVDDAVEEASEELARVVDGEDRWWEARCKIGWLVGLLVMRRQARARRAVSPSGSRSAARVR